jgi:predicted metal-binding protein
MMKQKGRKMYQTSFINRTPSAEISVDVKIAAVESRWLTEYENKQEIGRLCEACPAYGGKWSCPPHSPAFSQYDLNEYPYTALVLFSCVLDQFSYTKTEYIKIKAANTIMKSRMDRLMRGLEQTTSGIMISNGNCRLCNPCSKKKGEPCKKPERMRFSMEALGHNVGRITSDVFGHDILWYRDKKIPLYLSAAACLLMKEGLSESVLGEAVEDILKTFSPY